MNGARWKPVGFVVATLVLWWAIGSAGYVVVKCIPGGDACPFRNSPGLGLVSAAEASVPPGTPTGAAATQGRRWWPEVTKHDWLVFLSLVTALWVAKVAIYPYEDEPAAG